MNKWLVVSLAFCFNAQACESVPSTGSGKTYDDAVQDALQKAIHTVVGQVIVSERETVDLQVKRESILNYSSGYINNYTVLQHTNNGNKNTVNLDACVERSKISQRILGTPSDFKNFDPQPGVKYASFMVHKQRGDALLQQVLNDFPAKAFDISSPGNFRVSYDMYRNVFLEVPFKMAWNYNYINALNEVAGLISDGSRGVFTRSPGNLIVMAKDPKDYVFGKKTHHQFNDVVSVNHIRTTWNSNPPRIVLKMVGNNNNSLFEHCYTPDSVSGKLHSFYSTGETLLLYGNQVESNIIRVSLQNMTQVLQNTTRIELRIAGNETCS